MCEAHQVCSILARAPEDDLAKAPQLSTCKKSATQEISSPQLSMDTLTSGKMQHHLSCQHRVLVIANVCR
eukprot:5223929-Amphidinium_carterae.2